MTPHSIIYDQFDLLIAFNFLVLVLVLCFLLSYFIPYYLINFKYVSLFFLSQQIFLFLFYEGIYGPKNETEVIKFKMEINENYEKIEHIYIQFILFIWCIL